MYVKSLAKDLVITETLMDAAVIAMIVVLLILPN